MDYRLISSARPELPLLHDLRGRMESRAEAGAPFFIALSGGSSPLELYAMMAREDLPWSSVFVLQADERIVAPGHGDHNFSKIERLLLDPVSLPKNRRIAVDTEEKPGDYASRIDELFLRYGRSGLDAAVLGMGEDGHTASVFPEEEDPLARQETAYRAYSPRHPHERVSLSLPFLSRSQVLYLLVKGETKRPVLEKLLWGRGGWDYPNFPVALLPPERLRIYTDIEKSSLTESSFSYCD